MFSMANVQKVGNTPTCRVDEDDCLSLLSILKAFDAPINEERTWAVLYQAAKCAHSCFLSSATTTSTDSSKFKCCVASEPAHLLIHRDGSVHPKSFTVDITSDLSEGRTVATSQSKLVSALGWAVFEALDYGCTRDEHHALSPDLEQIIDLMTASGEECNSAEDEGIERDSSEMEEPSSAIHPNALTSLTQVLDRCQMQISSTASSVQADTHFRAVCRALVAETLEFSDFLAKVTSGPEEWRELRSKPELQCPELTELHLADWARLWVQVIRQLRNGVKLKSKSESARKPIEYELTPYEMMMDDIRSRRYKLRTVMVDGQIPQRVKKDAHAVILEFIRSRPPLRKASERTLRPVRKVSTPVELLMESIRQHDHRGLRPTKSLMVDKTDMSSSISSLTSKRKLLKADFDQLLPNSANDDDDDLADIPASSPPHDSFASSASFNGMFESCTSSEVSTPLSSKPDAGCKGRNLSTCASHLLFPTFQGCGSRETSPSRRHSSPNVVTRTMSAPFPKSQSHHAQLQSSYAQQQHKEIRRRIPVHLHGGDSLPSSGPASSASSTSSVSIPSPPGSPCMLPVLDPLVEHARLANIQDEFLQSKNFESVDCLALTLEEMVHIRRVLTKADLEDLPLESSVKDDIAIGKVCFVCLKTRFGFFGPSGHRCKLCMQVVCSKCCSKMRIPTEHFANVPVFTLAPTRCAQQQFSQQQNGSASLFSNFHLRIPQFRIHAPVDVDKDASPNTSTPVTGGSTPSSPWFSRRRKNATAAPSSNNSRPNSLSILTSSWAQQHQDQRRESLSAESTPRKSRISRSESVRNKTGIASSSEHPVCRDCQTLIEQIVRTADTMAVVPDPVHSSVPVSLP